MDENKKSEEDGCENNEEDLKKKRREALNKLNTHIELVEDLKNNSLNEIFNCLEEEIDIRTESLKFELDKLEEGNTRCLEKLKSFIKKRINDANDVSKFENSMKGLTATISSNKKSINVHSDTAIGEIGFNDDGIIKDFLSGDKIFVQKSFKFTNEVRPIDLCVLPNGRLLVVGRSCLLEYSPKMTQLRCINELKNPKNITFNNDKREKDCMYAAATTNYKERIYLTDENRYLVIETNLNFEILRYFDLYDSEKPENSPKPKGICFYKNSLFVCLATGLLQISVDKFEQVSIKKLFNVEKRDHLEDIKCNDNHALITIRRNWSGKYTYYIDLDNYSTYGQSHLPNIILVGSSQNYFYYFKEISVTSHLLHIENKKREPKKFISITKSLEQDKGSICMFNSTLILCDYKKNELILLEAKKFVRIRKRPKPRNRE